MAKTQLKNVAPTEAELKKAREVLEKAGEKGFRSKQQSMMQFIKDQPDAAVSVSRGDERKRYIELFLVHQMRCQDAVKKVSVVKGEKNTDKKFIDLHWWSEETMDKEMGAMKAQGLRDSKKLPFRPCQLTGSKEAHMIEWGVPIEWESFSSSTWNEIKITADQDAVEGDEELLTLGGIVANSSTPNAVIVKEEGKSGLDVIKEKMKEFIDNIPSTLRLFQDMNMQAKLIKTKGDKAKMEKVYIGKFIDDVTVHVGKLTKTIKMLEKAITDTMEEAQAPRFLDMLESLKSKHEEINEWAVKFDLVELSPKKKTRKNR